MAKSKNMPESEVIDFGNRCNEVSETAVQIVDAIQGCKVDNVEQVDRVIHSAMVAARDLADAALRLTTLAESQKQKAEIAAYKAKQSA